MDRSLVIGLQALLTQVKIFPTIRFKNSDRNETAVHTHAKKAGSRLTGLSVVVKLTT